ncbi:MAG: translocation/assembly module TamB domain-containing protein [Rhodohalobacter sp.]|nr:translocation/assembly module TamB domain-containing protein [Rhodohalobacter sp.]
MKLESGGTIIWEGDPANARLDVNAVYSARPDINTLSGTGARDPENAQRVPVELVLNIGGTLTSIENNFFFRLPNTFESQQNSTLSTQLASINRDENLKLIQATNFMLMGDFIPVFDRGSTN